MWWSWFIEQRRSLLRRNLQEERENGGAWCLLGSHSRKFRDVGSIRKSLAYYSFAFTHATKLLNPFDWGLIFYYGQFDMPEEWGVIRGTGHLKINYDMSTQLKKIIYEQIDDRSRTQMLITLKRPHNILWTWIRRNVGRCQSECTKFLLRLWSIPFQQSTEASLGNLSNSVSKAA